MTKRIDNLCRELSLPVGPPTKLQQLSSSRGSVGRLLLAFALVMAAMYGSLVIGLWIGQ